MIGIKGTPYKVEDVIAAEMQAISARVAVMRSSGKLTPEILSKLRKYFRIKNIYHSNAIEGNTLDAGETRLVVEQGLTITGKPLKDQTEARNLSHALDFLEELASNLLLPITEADIRQIHQFILKDINDGNAGVYRTVDVEISGSQYKPPSPESIPAEMAGFGVWIKSVSIPGQDFITQNAILVACVIHTWFVTIHPFIDGNGRVARLLMNLILMRYRFPIAVVTREDRLRYYDALETSQSSDLTPFIALIAECIEESLSEYEKAVEERREEIEWAKSIASKFDKSERIRAANRYEVWKNAMELLKSLFKQTVETLNASTNMSVIYFREFGILEFEKYISMKNHGSVKKTWFFRLDFVSGNRVVRYMFFFGAPSYSLKTKSDVTLYISREEPPGSYRYNRTDTLSAPNVPNPVEIGYNVTEEKFFVRLINGTVHNEKADDICRKFVTEVAEKHFG
jgi:Fic family protein